VTDRLGATRSPTTQSSAVGVASGSAAAPVPVLIVDDHPGKRLSLKAALAPLGHSIVEADSGRAALRKIMVQDFAVILLDVRMPDMDGFETAALIRQRRQSEMTPIIFITAYTSDELPPSDRWADGAVDFIFSPVPPEELRAKVSVFANLFLRATTLAAQAREVQISADQLRLLTDAAPIGIFQTDRRNRYVYTNPRWTEITGIRSDEAAGQRWDDIIGVRQPDNSGPAGNGPGAEQELSQRFELRPPDGTSRIALVTSKAIPGLNGGIAGWVGTLADVTVEARAETAMADARDRATEASRLKSDFLANMSHEIRTPMNGVIGMTDLLLETDLDARQRDYAQTVRNSGTALLAIIDDILDFSKVEAGKLDVEAIEFSLWTVVEDLVDLLSGAAQAKGLELIAIIEGTVPAVVRGDPGRVRQVLTNLIGNAIKFTRTGEIVVRVAEAEPSDLGTVVRFEVSDTGDGIATDKLTSIFEPFTQADTSTSRKYGGTGLGLAISAHLVALMGGQCGVSSELGTGSAFWFTVTVQAGTPAADLSALGPDVRLAGLAALIVDGNATQRAMLSGYLTGWGMTVIAAGSGPEAEDALDNAASAGQPFAVAVVDRALLATSTQQVRDAFADTALATRLVVMTPISKGIDIDDVGAPAGSPTVTKPIHQARLRHCLEAALGRGSPEGAPPEVAGGQRLAPGDVSTGALVLVAEDNLINQKVVVAMLTNKGYRVDIAPNGEDAVRHATAVRYDAIMMDCQMPVMDGYEATRAIRAAEGALHRTPIIALTASAMVGEEERCRSAGMDDFVTKPINREQLLATLERWAGLADYPQESEAEVTIAWSGAPVGAGANAALLDADVIGELIELDGGGIGLLTELVDLFRGTVVGQLDELDASIARGDSSATGKVAHVITGTSASIGAARVAALSRELQLLAGQDRLQAAPPVAVAVRRAIVDALAALDQRIAMSGEQPGRPLIGGQTGGL
jgi:two-component system sensor histidine kinase/response regulator